MGGRLAAALALIACALGALAAFMLAGGVPAGAGARPGPDGTVQEVPPPLAVTKPQVPSLSRLRETVQRPLFSATRRPPPPESGAAPQPVATRPAQPVKAPTAQISAIVMVGDDRYALLDGPGGNGPERKREGDEVQGWTVARIDGNGVLLQRGASRHEMPLRTFGPAPKPPPLRPKARAPQAEEPAPAGRELPRQAARDDAVPEPIRPEEDPELLEELEEEAERVREAIERRRARREQRE